MTSDGRSADQLLEQAAAALRSLPTPAGPSDEVMARTFAALAVAEPRALRFSAKRSLRRAVAVAAGLLLALGGLLYFGSSTVLGPKVAWAEAAAKLRDARTLTYVMTIGGTGSKVPSTARFYFKSPGRMRVDGSTGIISIMDGDPHHMLFLDTTTKTGYFSQPKPKVEPEPKATDEKKATGTFRPSFQVADRPDEKTDKFEFSGFEKLRNLAKEKGEPIGKKRIGDVEAQGFRIMQRGQEFTAWVDPRSRLPLAIEQSIRIGDKELTSTMSDFVYDPPLDDALFSLTPPPGYKMTTGELQIMGTEESLIQLLRLYAQASGGNFPPKLDDWFDYDKTLQTDRFKKPGAATNPEYMQLVQTSVRAMMFVLENKDRATYRPEGVKLGDADKLLLWYQPKGSEKHRAIYGDLRAAEIAADQLPPKP